LAGFRAHHPGPQRNFIEHSHELMRAQHRIATVQDPERQMVEIALEPLGLRIHHRRESLGNPWELTRFGGHHAQEAEVLGLLVKVQDGLSDQP
jgi:hypothetical protein